MKSHARNVKCFWLSGGRPVWRRNTELLKRCRSPKKWTLYCAVKGTHLDLRRIANEKGADVHTDGESCSVRDGLARCGARTRAGQLHPNKLLRVRLQLRHRLRRLRRDAELRDVSQRAGV